jgi:hypothetical protein
VCGNAREISVTWSPAGQPPASPETFTLCPAATDDGVARIEGPTLNVSDGATAAMYVRSRHGRSDWNRARRQQAVLLGVRHELETLGGLAKLPSLWDELEASVQTDLRRVELLALARRAFAVEPSHLHGLVLGAAEMHGEMTSDGRAVLIPDPSAIERALAGLFSAPSPGAALPGAKCAPKDAALRARAGS